MTRAFALCLLAAVVWPGSMVATASAQSGQRVQPRPVTQIAVMCDLRGVVLDEGGQPLADAVVSALGATTAFEVSDREGRFTFRNLPRGPYLVRVHLNGYRPARARTIQLEQGSRVMPTITLTRGGNTEEPTEILAAGVGGLETSRDRISEGASHDHGEVAWRMRHLKRSVLKEATAGLGLVEDHSFFDDPVTGLTRAVGTPARLASSLFAELPLSGQINLLTRTSFDTPHELFSSDTWLPRGIAFLSLEAPAATGDWTMRGAITQGDVSSWILAGSFVRDSAAEHRYEAGMSYGMQRYLGGNADALAAVSDGGRNVGVVYAYDQWRVNRRLSVGYGARYARYDYLTDRGLFSPRLNATVHAGAFDIRATMSRRALAPGAEEFIPPETGLWLPPERTFSPASARTGFTPERLDHYEIAAERDVAGDVVVGVRAFRQSVDDQLVTLFGIKVPGTASSSVGHYYVASAGDVEARGWGVSVSRDVSRGVRASVDYTYADSTWVGASPDATALSGIGHPVGRDDAGRLHDLTTSVESIVPATDTRVFVLYKINSRFADASAAGPRPGARFDLQLHQSLPFLNFTHAQWEMLIAIRNLFREELIDASIYDEVLVVRPPKRVVGGVTVRF